MPSAILSTIDINECEDGSYEIESIDFLNGYGDNQHYSNLTEQQAKTITAKLLETLKECMNEFKIN